MKLMSVIIPTIHISIDFQYILFNRSQDKQNSDKWELYRFPVVNLMFRLSSSQLQSLNFVEITNEI